MGLAASLKLSPERGPARGEGGCPAQTLWPAGGPGYWGMLGGGPIPSFPKNGARAPIMHFSRSGIVSMPFYSKPGYWKRRLLMGPGDHVLRVQTTLAEIIRISQALADLCFTCTRTTKTSSISLCLAMSTNNLYICFGPLDEHRAPALLCKPFKMHVCM